MNSNSSVLERENHCVIPLAVVNCLFTCCICGGYWREATTICDCLHTFCKPCIYKHIRQQGRCPRCWSKISPRNEPWICAHEDKRLQEILQAVLPQIKEDVEEFQAISIPSNQAEKQQAPKTAPSVAEYDNLSYPVAPLPLRNTNSHWCLLQLSPIQGSTLPSLGKPFLRVPPDITVRHLKKYVCLKLCNSGELEIEIYSGYDLLPPTIPIHSVLKQSNQIINLFYGCH
ncbi:hypothetical protein GAYE_SCF06G2733A [Galdieria yellowstonensis]|uniref:RING-type domain-containing protein n=1 Tax=Galdieria yellowstonensis TaxID=3028027 RepID=A0AAV9ICA4_9RHOD|nr:hypothetical protein GAYE_SCF06G2733A [Galdieria yellowstonensis]